MTYHDTPENVAMLKKVRAYYRDVRGTSESALPCSFCVFDVEEDTDCGHVWITCEADDEDGCNWGNV